MMRKILILLIAIAIIFPGQYAGAASSTGKITLSVTSSSPSQNQIDVDTAAVIQVKFNQNILKGSSFSKMKLTDASNKDVAFTADISGLTLNIKPNAPLGYSVQYTFSMPVSAVKDKAGNINKSVWKLSFKTLPQRIPVPVDLSKELTPLLAGVKKIYGSGCPSPLMLCDPAWVPIVAGDEDSGDSPVFSAVRGYGSGRILAVGQEGILTDAYIGNLDNLKFVENSVQWLNYNGTGCKKVAVLSGHGEWATRNSMNTLVKDMSSKGYVFSDLSQAATRDPLKNIDVIIIGNAWKEFTIGEIRAIKNFVSGGGGMLLCGLGWSYNSYKTGTYPMNTLGAEFRITFDNSYITETDDLLKGFPIFHEIYPNITSCNSFTPRQTVLNKINADAQAAVDAKRAADAEKRIAAKAAASPDKKAHILFIGNSLTYVGEIPETFASIMQVMEEPVQVDERTMPGYTLREHLPYLQSGQYDSLIDNADIVILQEYGGGGIDVNSIKQIQNLFDPGTEFYFMITEFDTTDKFPQLADIKDIDNLKYIPTGYAHNLLLNKGFTYQQLHVANDYHPNKLYGYLSACTIYSMIFDTTCRYLPYNFLDMNTITLIPGSNAQEKAASIDKMQLTVQDAVKPIKEYQDKKAVANGSAD